MLCIQGKTSELFLFLLFSVMFFKHYRKTLKGNRVLNIFWVIFLYLENTRTFQSLSKPFLFKGISLGSIVLFLQCSNYLCFISSLYEIPVVSSSSFFEEFGKLLRETDEMDNIHDVTFQVGNRLFPAHKYVLAVRSDFFQKLFLSDGTPLELTDVYRKDEDAAGCHLFVVEKVHPDLFEYLLQFMYTDTCDFLTHGFKPRILVNKNPEDCKGSPDSHMNKKNCPADDNQKAAFEVYKSNQAHTVSEKQKSKHKSSKKGKGVGEDDPVRMLQNVAKKFGLSNLSSRYVPHPLLTSFSPPVKYLLPFLSFLMLPSLPSLFLLSLGERDCCFLVQLPRRDFFI